MSAWDRKCTLHMAGGVTGLVLRLDQCHREFPHPVVVKNIMSLEFRAVPYHFPPVQGFGTVRIPQMINPTEGKEVSCE
jgi:hypothetical protein